MGRRECEPDHPSPEPAVSSRFVLILCALATAGCATTGATVGSGVGERLVSEAPFHAGVRRSPIAPGTPVLLLPLRYDAGGRDAASTALPDTPSALLRGLLDEMAAFLADEPMANGETPIRLDVGDPFGVPPDVHLGCLTVGNLPGEDCEARGDSVLGRNANLQQLRLSVGRPSPQWVEWLQARMDSAGAAYALVVTVDVGERWLRQRGILGRKFVDLGTRHEVSLPWMTSLETPVATLQLAGALVDREGKALRIGVEGLLAKRTPLLASTVGAEALVTEADVAALREARRRELPGQPLVWQQALRELLHGLTR